MDELASATGLFRTSLVAAFGTKRGLFLRALEQYCVEGSARVRMALERATLRDALTRLFSGAIEDYVGAADHPPGCFLMSTAVLEASTDPEVAALVTGHLQEIEEQLAARLVLAEAARDVASSAGPDVLASVIASALVSIAVRARAGASRRALLRTASRIVDLVCGAKPSRR